MHTAVQRELMGFKWDFVNYSAKHCRADPKRINEIGQILKLHSHKLVTVGMYCSCSVILRWKRIGHYISSLWDTSSQNIYLYILIVFKHTCNIYAYLQNNWHNNLICIIHTLVLQNPCFSEVFFFLLLVLFNPLPP